ncbi:uncharacterized protein LOC127253202 [Andrographis paniculata]|uniref:uncharacterized protein LOC127253202 n=1 Tax=Andrographis paniculata TaxID=175694 RepID=UPI0021E8B626|nr:uncharacterized protein LOC127253202 [Andrographis paniculata]
MVEPSRTSAQAPVEDPGPNDPTNNFVTCIHQVRVEEIFCHVTVTWAKTMISHTLYITVENPTGGSATTSTATGAGNEEEENHYTCKIDLKTWQFWGKKGLKTFRVAEKRFDVFWDLRAAKFSSRPEPDSSYYVAMVSSGEMVLLLGDQRDEAVKRTKSRICLEGTMLVHKKEIVYAKKCFCTKMALGRNGEHSIMIEASLTGPCDPEMWIVVDGRESIRVPNLHWRFRGNDTIIIDEIPVQILWDVHGWLYNNGSNDGVGIFAFRRVPEDEGNGSSEEEAAALVEFCHFVYACRI